MFDSIPILLLLSVLTGYTWRKLYDTVDTRIQNYHVSQNVINCLHAISLATLTFYPSLENLMIVNSTGFFVHDIFILSKIRNFDRWHKWLDPLVLHHFIAMHALWNIYFGIYREVTLLLCCILELSNIPMYMSTFCLRIFPQYQLVNHVLLYNQFIVFTGIRIIYTPYRFLTDYRDLLLEMVPLYHLELGLVFLAGMVWSYKLGRKAVQYQADVPHQHKV